MKDDLTLRQLIQLSFFILLIVFSLACSRHQYSQKISKKEGSYTLLGKIDGLDSGVLYLQHSDTAGHIIFDMPELDSTNIKSGFFLFKGKIASPEPRKIMVKNLEQGWKWTKFFILDTGITTAQLYADSMYSSVVIGNELQTQFATFNNKLFDLDTAYQKTAVVYRKEAKNTDSLDSQYTQAKYALILKEVKTYPASFVSAYLVKRNLDEQMPISYLEELYNSIDNKNNHYSNALLTFIKAKKQTQLNKPAPSFKIIDSKNRTLTNETFKGKYLLIDFWASWCAPCREQNPNLVKAYNKYARKGLEMISVSVDKNKQEWEDAVKHDSLTWIQACDLKGAESKIDKDFGFLTIPTNFLIDKEGKIIDRNLSDERIEKVLHGIFQ